MKVQDTINYCEHAKKYGFEEVNFLGDVIYANKTLEITDPGMTKKIEVFVGNDSSDFTHFTAGFYGEDENWKTIFYGRINLDAYSDAVYLDIYIQDKFFSYCQQNGILSPIVNF